MHQIAKKGLAVTALATGGTLFAGLGVAHADSGAQGTTSDSPGVASGNSVQAPVHVPVNICGNTINVLGLLNPATGNSCGNVSEHHQTPPPETTPPKTPPPETTPPQQPEPSTPPKSTPPPSTPPVSHAPERSAPAEPVSESTPESHAPQPSHAPKEKALAETGSEINPAVAASIAGGAMLGGVVLYRRARPSRRR